MFMHKTENIQDRIVIVLLRRMNPCQDFIFYFEIILETYRKVQK